MCPPPRPQDMSAVPRKPEQVGQQRDPGSAVPTCDSFVFGFVLQRWVAPAAGWWERVAPALRQSRFPAPLHCLLERDRARAVAR